MAQHHLAVRHRYGLGVPKDLTEAQRLFSLAAGQGFDPANAALEDLAAEREWTARR